MKIFRYSLIATIIILLFPVLNAQDITGDWYGVFQRDDSLHVTLHIYKDHRVLKGIMVIPEWVPQSEYLIDEITLVKDTLSYRISARDIVYQGLVNQDFSRISGVILWGGDKTGIDFSRKKQKRIFAVNYNSMKVTPANLKVIKAGAPRIIPYSGIRVVETGIPEVTEIDTSGLKVLTPGKDNILNPEFHKYPEPVIREKNPYNNIEMVWYPFVVSAKQTRPIPALPMRMKEAACFNIQYLDVEQGLIDPFIHCIMEDTKGNMWFGSEYGGVCRYDGRSLIYYTTEEGLTHNGSMAIIEDRSGNIWIGTHWGLCKYDGRSFTQFYFRIFGSIVSMLESGNGDIWIGTYGNGVVVKKGNFWVIYTESEGLTSNYVRSIAEDRNGNLWFGTDMGVSKFDGVSFTHYTENEGLISNRVTSVIEDRHGNLWFGTEQGVSKYDGKSFRQFTTKEGLSNNNIHSIKEDSEGYLWFGTDAGVNLFDGKSFTYLTEKEGLLSNNIQFITEDKNKNIWMSTVTGVMKLQRNSFTYFPFLKDIGKGSVTSIIEGLNGNIWFGIVELGLVEYNGESFKAMTEKQGLRNTSMLSILGDKNGNIWFDYYGSGLQKYDGNSIQLFYDEENIASNYVIWEKCIYEDIKGNIWIGRWSIGLKIFDGESFIYFLNNVLDNASNYISSILQDKNENIWWGSIRGLYKYNGEYIIAYDINEGLSDMRITSLFEDKTSNIWIGTKQGGINKFDGKSFTYFTEEEGISNNSITSIIGDNRGNIWVGTIKGLSLLSPQGDGNYSIISFGMDDGLKSLTFNDNSVCLDSRNRLWWGTGTIVTMLDLNTFDGINTKPPVIQLNNINLNQNYIDFRAMLSDIGEVKKSPSDTGIRKKFRGLRFSDVAPFYNYPLNLKLPHYLNHVTFNFSAIDWAAPQSIRYQYMVEGMDKEWSPLNNENQADYRNISSGRYIFKVRALSKGNTWSETFEYPFTVRPPWWLRWWAYTFYTVVLIILARSYIRYRVGREQVRAEIQMKQFEVDKMQELDDMKSRFFANISHEFRTPLTLIIGPIEDIFKRKSKRPELTWDIAGIIHRNAKRLQKLVNQILDLSKLETGEVKLQVSEGNFEEFLRVIIFSFLSLAESKKIKYEFYPPEINQTLYFDSDKVEKIITNLISNALKFTPEGGSVKVTLQYSGEKNYTTEKNIASGKSVAPGKDIISGKDVIPRKDVILEKNVVSGKNVISGPFAEVTVKDTGPGISDEEKKKIFGRFYQVSSSDSREHEGSGIGLALARELVELYRGEIHVDSEVGKGSTFTVRLPVVREQFREDEIIDVSEKPAEAEIFGGHEIVVQEAAESDVQKETVKGKDKEIDKDLPIILIVEDNMDLRKYISGNLSGHYQILEAGNGKEGLDKTIENIPDLVISDLMMPEMNGMEMCEHLKKDTRTNHIPLIMLTAKADRESKIEGLETGADDYIIKPFDAEELQVRVKNLIEQRKKLREKYRKEFLTDPSGKEIPPPEDEFLVRFMNCTQKHMEDPEFGVEQLGKELHMSRVQLYRKVVSLTDYTPSEYIRNIRLKTAARMFQEGHTNITTVLYTVGYSTPSHFTQSFRELFGMNPSEYIKQKTKSRE